MGLENGWYVAAASKELGARPLARRVLGQALVLFRGRGGTPVALEDRCPHRNVSLSLGRMRSGNLECAYHGWQFDESGACVKTPCAGSGESCTARPIPKFRCIERGGSIWVALSEDSPAEPPEWPHDAERGYQSFELVTQLRCPMVWVLNNFVDCGHTGFVHAGLFRGEPKKTIRAFIEERPTGVRIETFGETDPNSLLSRLLLPFGGSIRHVDEYLAPHTVKVDYWLGKHHVVTTSICTPEDDQHTRVYTRVAVRFGVASPVVLAALKRMTKKILEQDRVILEDQAAQLRRFGRASFSSMDADQPTVWVTRVHQQVEAGKWPRSDLRSAEVTYTL